MSFLRSILFMLWAIVLTIVLASIVVLVSLVSRPLAFKVSYYWRRGFMWAVEAILGIKTEMRGLDNIPAEPAVILSKHQSAWETVALQDIVAKDRYCVFVMKKELLRLPFFGWALGAVGMISIDRKAGKNALDQVVEQGADRLKRGYYIIVFPEGTRVAPGQKKRYKPGGAYLATHVGAKVVPVAHNAGELWPRQAFLKKPGTITISIGPAFDAAGMSEQEVNQRVEDWVESEMRKLSPHRYPDARVKAAAAGA